VVAKIGPSALIVADQASGRRYARALAALGIRATLVATTKQAVQHCKQNKIDLLISNVILEEKITGYELARKISKVCPFPVLMISKYPLELIRAVRGFDNTIPRLIHPFSPEEIAKRAKRLIQSGKD
jgi:DNA-binding response OmpR family regulator